MATPGAAKLGCFPSFEERYILKADIWLPGAGLFGLLEQR